MSDKREAVNHPAHYNVHPSGVECITVVEHMGFNLGNAVKYIWRADLKADAFEDLNKAAWYVTREIEKRRGTGATTSQPAPAPAAPVEHYFVDELTFEKWKKIDAPERAARDLAIAKAVHKACLENLLCNVTTLRTQDKYASMDQLDLAAIIATVKA